MKRTDLGPLSAFAYPSKMLRTVHYIFNERDVGISTAGLDRDESSSPIQAYLKRLKKMISIFWEAL